MSINEESENPGLEKFIKVAIKYYETKYGTPQRNLKEKAMAQWLDLASYKDKMKVMEFMQNKIKQIETSQIKITKYFKISKPSVVRLQQDDQLFDNDITEQQQQQEIQTGLKTAQKREKSPYTKFYEETFWKIKLENEYLNANEIKSIVKRRWESSRKPLQVAQ